MGDKMKMKPPRDDLIMSPKQIRARERRARRAHERIAEQMRNMGMLKPISHWDLEELARGKPKNSKGNFHGVTAPPLMTREHHEEIMARFKTLVKGEMQVHSVEALKVLGKILDDNSTDKRGRPLVSASTKLEAAKFLVEHVVGKPTQRVEQDISVRLQAILANVMVAGDSPDEAANAATQLQQLAAGSVTLADAPVDAEIIEDEDDD